MSTSTAAIGAKSCALRAEDQWLLCAMLALGDLRNHGFIDFPEIWPYLSTSSRSWLMEHNGEPLPDDVIAEILSVTGGEQNAQWWTGPPAEGQTQLTDEAVDWIETVANDDEG